MFALTPYHKHKAAKKAEREYYHIKELVYSITCFEILFQRFDSSIFYRLFAHYSQRAEKYGHLSFMHSVIEEGDEF